MKSLPQKESQH